MKKKIVIETQIILNVTHIREYEAKTEEEMQDKIDNFVGQLGYHARNEDYQSILESADSVGLEEEIKFNETIMEGE